MNAFSPLRITLRSGCQPLRILYPATLFLGFLALSRLPAEPDRLWLVLLTYLLIGGCIVWHQLSMDSADEIVGLDWDVEHKMMSILTLQGRWIPVEKMYRRVSLLGVFQLLVLQRRDRALPSWLWITPDRLTRSEARRLHVAINWGAPIESNQAIDS